MKTKKNKSSPEPALPLYPMLEKRQKSSTVIERRVRRLLNEQTQKDDEAAGKLLSAISPEKRGAEYYFLSGCLRYRLGYITDAPAYLDRACALSQGKIREYEVIRDTLASASQLSPEEQANFVAVNPDGMVYQPKRAFVFWSFMGECCAEGCCECACEGCADGCSCDC